MQKYKCIKEFVLFFNKAKKLEDEAYIIPLNSIWEFASTENSMIKLCLLDQNSNQITITSERLTNYFCAV